MLALKQQAIATPGRVNTTKTVFAANDYPEV